MQDAALEGIMRELEGAAPPAEAARPEAAPEADPFDRMLRSGRKVRKGWPLEMKGFDSAEEVLVVVHDQNALPEPELDLQPGYAPGEMILKMEGEEIVRLRDAEHFSLDHVCVIGSDSGL